MARVIFFKKLIFIRHLVEKRPEINPLHFLTNILGMAIFPFIAQPIFIATSIIDTEQFKALIEERKALIPVRVAGMLDIFCLEQIGRVIM